MRLLHTADLHLGKVLHEQSLIDDQAHILQALAHELETGGYDLFLVAGDVYDRSVPPPEAVMLWDDFLHRITQNCPQLQTVIIPGNHDGAVRLSFASRFLDQHRVHLRTRTEDLDRPVTLTLAGQRWDIFAVPFLQAGSLETSRAENESVWLRSQSDLWKTALERLAQARQPGVPSILMAHLFTQGGSESDSERIFVGEAEQVPAAWLGGWDYVALGHLHRPQEPAPGVRYSGSPLAYSFSEAGQPKNALRWDDGVVTPVPLIPLRPLTRLRGSFDELARGESGDAYRDHWVEITLTDRALVPSPLERLRPRYPGLLSLVQAPAQTAEPATEAPGRRTGDLVADGLRFLEEMGQTPDEATRTLLTDLAREVTDAAS